ncbi:MAG TPA: type II toxin-antitoxin system RelE/ParE family toxin [Xanthobacteraceae bacterium]|nr:type II toxin-antitoxin system RelE/ParE family toxin [Xanthobacteraceae bacterium]
MRLRYTPRARRHLDAIAQYIDERNPDAARRVGSRIQETINLLAAFPHMGHEGALSGTREFVVPGLPYIIVHRIEIGNEDTLVILGIYHGAQRRPGQR